MYLVTICIALLGLSGLAISFLQNGDSLVHHSTTKQFSRPIRKAKAVGKSLKDKVQAAALDDDGWENFRQKGNNLGCLLDATDENAGRIWPNYLNRNPPSISSPWQGVLQVELSTWGWVESVEETCEFDNAEGAANIKSALDALGLSTLPTSRGGPNICYSVDHSLSIKNDKGEWVHVYDQVYNAYGAQYHRTGGTCNFGVNRMGGALFGRAFMSPMFAAAKYWEETQGHPRPTIEMMPALRLASDIMAAHWTRNNPDPKNLKYYFAFTIINEQTLPLIMAILQKRGYAYYPKWPGCTVGMWEAEGEALLGSPIGTTIAYFLIQHKATLGIKHITEITIFRDDGRGIDEMEDAEDEEYAEMYLLFKIKDVPMTSGEEAAVQDQEGRGEARAQEERGASGGFVRRSYTTSESVQVHEFKIAERIQ